MIGLEYPSTQIITNKNKKSGTNICQSIDHQGSLLGAIIRYSHMNGREITPKSPNSDKKLCGVGKN